MTPVSDIAKGNILVVDDTPANLRLLSTILERSEYTVRQALSGELALQAAQTHIPDLILLDIGMPEMDGYEVCRRLQANKITCQIPIIFISAYDEVMDKVRGFKIGGVDYITKPFHWAEVIARVENQIKILRLSQQLQRKNAQLEQEIHERVHAESALRGALERLKTLANLDGLTHIANRRRFDEFLNQYWQADEPPHSISLVLTDVDYFKNYNDTYGHLEGDRCLQQVAHLLQGALTDMLPNEKALLARYGGEEFGIVIIQTPAVQVAEFAHTCHRRIRERKITHQGSPANTYLSMSFGVATLKPNPQQPATQLIDCADQSLYQAKATGRDRVVVYHPTA
ncbi:MAG: diguanylate cyclase [Spirulina sp. SIO3F2]|nr:diguanylate cyclase [Spirulina sp. SIO3F2]